MIRLALPFAVLACPLAAETLAQDYFPRLTSCYLRLYGDAHLKAHPDQRVRKLLVLPERNEVRPDTLVLRVAVVLRDNFEIFDGSAYCQPGKAGFSCQMEGDAGAFTLERARADALRLTVDAQGISFEGSTGFITLEGSGGDDRVFLLPMGDCP